VVGEAGDGQSGSNLAHELRPDLVIMDIRLSGTMDGIDAASTLTLEQIAPVLLLTGFSDVELAERAAKVGVAGYLVKPFTRINCDRQ
jgi:YesN/AraC family two-component response regulator